MMAVRIALYGFGTLPIVFRHLIEEARRQNAAVEFCAILTAPNWRNVMREVLPQRDILDIYGTLPREPEGGDLTKLKNYRGNLTADLAALKFTRRRRSGPWRFKRGVDYYCLYKSFLSEQCATHLLMSGIETPDAKIAVAVAQELRIKIIAPVDMRNLGGTYFSIDSYETPPAYAAATPELHQRAKEFVGSFRREAAPPRHVPNGESGADADTILNQYLPSFTQRVSGFITVALERPDLFDPEMIRVSVMRTLGFIRDPVRGLRRWRNAQQFDIDRADRLPGKFIYYPLQYTPESSINVPAPYFVDQLRVIDALRFAMPNDCTLVVKEHPACLEMRKPWFMRYVRTLPGVVVVNIGIPSIDLIKLAALTATVTGTAALEAFILGRPAIALGPGLSAWMLGKVTTLGSLADDIAAAITRPPSETQVVDQVAKLISVQYPFFFATPYMAGEPMLRRGNIRRFWSALVNHLERDGANVSHFAKTSAKA
jgi:Capsule polysaccharide biosynthesis protein